MKPKTTFLGSFETRMKAKKLKEDEHRFCVEFSNAMWKELSTNLFSRTLPKPPRKRK